jgi:hypothetical protein
MSESALAGQLKALETQLAALRAQARAAGAPTPQSFAVLYGIFAGQAESTEQEIEAAKGLGKLLRREG